MFEVNKVQLIGYVGNDSVYAVASNGVPMCKFSIATTIPYVKQNGDHATKTNWHNITVFGEKAKSVSEMIIKGVRCKVQGYIDNSEKKNSDGSVTKYTNILATTVELDNGNTKLSNQDDSIDDYINYAFCEGNKKSSF